MKTDLTNRLNNLVNNPTVTPIDLTSMEEQSLQIRFDTKFLISVKDCLALLAEAIASYQILDIRGIRIQHYDSYYYDHPNMRSYDEHLRSKSNRYKIRKRSYVQSDLHYIEIKQKENTGRTTKYRKAIPQFEEKLSGKQEQFLQSYGHKTKDLEMQIRVQFYRLTLASKSKAERITIDFGLNFERKDLKTELPMLALIEVKQGQKTRDSVMLELLKLKHIRPESFSKYCLGMSLLEPELKSNMYKEKILKINKMKTEYGILSNTIL